MGSWLNRGYAIDPRIGDQVFDAQSSAELPGLGLLIELAKKAPSSAW